VEHHPDPGLRGLARRRPPGARQHPEPAGDQLRQEQHCRRHAQAPYPVLGDPAEHDRAGAGVRHQRAGDEHSG